MTRSTHETGHGQRRNGRSLSRLKIFCPDRQIQSRLAKAPNLRPPTTNQRARNHKGWDRIQGGAWAPSMHFSTAVGRPFLLFRIVRGADTKLSPTNLPSPSILQLLPSTGLRLSRPGILVVVGGGAGDVALRALRSLFVSRPDKRRGGPTEKQTPNKRLELTNE